MRQSDLGVFAEPVLWYVRAKRTWGWVTAARSRPVVARAGARRFSLPWCLDAIMVSTKPSIIELDMKKLEELLGRAEAALGKEDYATVKALIESYTYLAELVGDKNTSIARLRKLLFGAKTEKTAAVVGKT